MPHRSFTRASLLTIALGFTALGSTLAPTGAYAHFGGGFAGAMGSASRIGTGSVAKLPTDSRLSGIAENSAVARLPAGKSSGRKIPTVADIPRFFPRGPIDPPRWPRPPRPPTGNGIGVTTGVDVTGPVGVAVDATVAGMVAQPVAGDCNCLVKQYLPNGSVLFKDLCTKESALSPNGAAAR
jgi:hypothetical protein